MFEELGKYANGTQVVVDTSFIVDPERKHFDLCKFLYNFRNLHRLGPNEIQRRIRNNFEIIEFVGKRQVFVLEEVLEELKEGLKQVNGHTRYFGIVVRRNHRTLRHKGVSKKAKWKSITEEERTNASLLGEYADSLYQLIKQLERRENRINMGDGMGARYQSFQNLVETLREESYEETLNLPTSAIKNPLEMGERLNTDNKIIAASFALAYGGDVLILTLDNGLVKKASDVGVRLGDSWDMLQYAGIEVAPEHKVTVYGARPRSLDDKIKNGRFTELYFPRKFQ